MVSRTRKAQTKRRNAKTRQRRGNRLGFGNIHTPPQLNNPILRKLQTRDPGTPTTRQEYRNLQEARTGAVNCNGTPRGRSEQSGLPPTPLAWEIRGRHAYQVPATPHHHEVAARVRDVLKRCCSPRLKGFVRSLTQGRSVRGSVLWWNGRCRPCHRWRSWRQAGAMLWAVWGLEPGEVSSVAGWDLS